MRVINLDKVLAGFAITHLQFIDLCILLGWNYSKALGCLKPLKAFQYIKSYKSIEGVLHALEIESDKLSEVHKDSIIKEIREFEYLTARDIINRKLEDSETQLEPEVKWGEVDQESVWDFLIEGKKLTDTIVTSSLTRISNQGSKVIQKRLSCFKI